MKTKVNETKLKKIHTSDMVKISLCTALLCISSYIVFPIPFTPIMITAQTIIVNLMALILNPVYTAISIIMFILLGGIGLPVFAGGNGGLGVILGPTGGFIIGFLFSGIAVSYFKGKKKNILKYLAVTILIGMPINYLFGSIYMSYISGVSYLQAIQLSVLPFLVGDIIKAVLACLIGIKLNNFL